MINNRLFRSTSLQLSVLLVTIFLAAFFILISLIWITDLLGDQVEIELSIRDEFSALEPFNLEQTMLIIEYNLARSNAPGYWLTDADGNHIAGNRPEFAGSSTRQAVSVQGTEDGETETWLVITQPLKTGEILSIGRSENAYRPVQRNFLGRMTLIALLVGAIAFYVGLLTSRRVLARLDGLRSTLTEVAGGDLTARYASQDDRDKSDLGEIGRGVNTMLARIEELVIGNRRLTQDIAHDLRTPLSQLQNHLKDIKETDKKASRAALIAAAENKVAEILRGFDAMLRLGELESGTAKQTFKPVDLSALAEKIISVYGPDIEDSERRYDLITTPDCMISGDAALLFQAVSNLMENAIKHTPAGSTITLRTDRAAGHALMSVCDNGPGILAKDRDYAIRPFHRLDESRNTPGSGLGLSIVAAIIKIHEGEMELGDHNPGLCVHLRFPGR